MRNSGRALRNAFATTNSDWRDAENSPLLRAQQRQKKTADIFTRYRQGLLQCGPAVP